jgi:hypothetical protein
MTTNDQRAGGFAGGTTFGRILPLVLLVLAVSTVVTVATNGLRLIVPAVDVRGGWAWGIRVAGAAAVVAGAMGLLAQRRRIRAEGRQRSDSTVVALGTAATIMGLLTVVGLATQAQDLRNGFGGGFMSFPIGLFGIEADGAADADRPPPAYGGDPLIIGKRVDQDRVNPADSTPLHDRLARYRALLQRIARALLLILLVVVVALRARILGQRLWRRRELPPDEPLAPEDAEAGLEASLGEVARDGGDPRRQITAAYRRLLEALAGAGAPRLPQEAPHEHLHRVLGRLGVPPHPLHRLTALYVAAHFSERPMVEGHRAAAADALQVSLASLRAAHGTLGRRGSVPVAEGAAS